ncbi:unnamed protein product [Allacma fusca]|uniref:Uncharacterized protein n=1 Tax=Allacma fusca TaxID=39272 RepID=A0A8J2KJV2_9HEXA|nr:unnamed protein product [Allacma fusca]
MTTGFTNPILRCPMPECPFNCRNHIQYESHVEDIHLFEHCGQYCSQKMDHRCQHSGERLGHVDGRHPVDLRNFAELSRSHLGVIVHYAYRHELNTDDLETAFTLSYNDLASFLAQIVSIYGNIRIEISVSLQMEKRFNSRRW